MNNEITAINPEQFGLQKKEASNIEKAFEPKIKEREILSAQYGELVKKDINLEICTQATELRRKLVKVRTGISDIHKSQKSFFLAAGKFVDAWKNKETLPVTQMEDGLRKIENHFEAIEEQKREKIRQERNAELEQYEYIYDAGDVAGLDDILWGHFMRGIKADYEEKKAEEAKVEKQRIEEQRISKLNTERRQGVIDLWQFMPEENKEVNFGTWEDTMWDELVNYLVLEKAVYDKEQKRIKAENEKLKKEAELKRIANEKAEIERQRLANIEQEKRDEADRKRFVKEQREHKEKMRLKKELGDRIEAERKQKQIEVDQLKSDADAKRKAELAPDKERMTNWIADMEIIDIVNDRMGKESVLMASEIIDKFNAFKKWATEKVNGIK